MDESELLPIQYHLEVYESSFVNDPSLSLTSSTPFLTLAVGDFFDHRGGVGNWHEPPEGKQGFRVKAVRHAVWKIDSSHIGFKVMVCVEVVDLQL